MTTQNGASTTNGDEEDSPDSGLGFSPFLPAWAALLRGIELPPTVFKQYSRSLHQRVQRLAYDELMRAVMDACRNLDLALRLPMQAMMGHAVAAKGGPDGATATGAATATETAALEALNRPGDAAAVAAAAHPAEASADAEDAAADWPVMSLARNAEDMQARIPEGGKHPMPLTRPVVEDMSMRLAISDGSELS